MNLSNIQINEQAAIVHLHPLHFNNLNNDVISSIFSKLKKDIDLENCSLVCKSWRKDSKEALYANNNFDENKWKENIGKVGNADGSPLPSLPVEIQKILKSSCRIWPNKTIGETHILVLLPETVNGKLLTLKIFGELLKKIFKNEKGYGNVLSKILEEHGDKPIEKSCWVLMPKKVLPGSKNKSFFLQEEMIKTLSEATSKPYKTPEALAAALCIFAMYCNRGEIRFFSRELTRCQEATNSVQVALGLLNKHGPGIYDSAKDLIINGIAPIWYIDPK
jgi:hypothetical protein